MNEISERMYVKVRCVSKSGIGKYEHQGALWALYYTRIQVLFTNVRCTVSSPQLPSSSEAAGSHLLSVYSTVLSITVVKIELVLKITASYNIPVPPRIV